MELFHFKGFYVVCDVQHALANSNAQNNRLRNSILTQLERTALPSEFMK